MRTTVEISDKQRAELLRIAGERGEKGFSSVVRDAIDFYVAQHGGREAAIRAALAVRGALSDEEADDMATEIEKARRHWR